MSKPETTDETAHLLAPPANATRLRRSIAQTTLESLPTRVVRLERDNKRLRDAASALLEDVRRRYPGEALRCPFMIALDEAVIHVG